MTEPVTSGQIVIVAGPSGVGKSSLCQRLLDSGQFELSVSATTRAPRGDEQEGVHYYFLSEEEFERRIAAEEFLEWARVHGKTYYGTPAAPVQATLARGKNVLLDIDVQGAEILRKRGLPVISVLLKAEEAELRRRLAGRGDTTPEQVEQRMAYAKQELAEAERFDLLITNHDLDRTEAALRAYLGLD